VLSQEQPKYYCTCEKARKSRLTNNQPLIPVFQRCSLVVDPMNCIGGTVKQQIETTLSRIILSKETITTGQILIEEDVYMVLSHNAGA
jgi:hypothetical protein